MSAGIRTHRYHFARQIDLLMRRGAFHQALEILERAEKRFPNSNLIQRLFLEWPIRVSVALTGGSAGANVGRAIHPSFELRRELVLFGFERETLEDDTGRTTSEKFRLVRGMDHPVIGPDRAPQIDVDGRTFTLKLQYDHPPRLQDEWSPQDLESFTDSPEAPAPGQLYNRLREAIHRHFDLSDTGGQVILASWPVLSFLYPAFPAVPFILLLGPKATGKTHLLEVLAELCRVGHLSRGTAAALGDLIESQRTTWLIDQADKLPEETLQVLTASYKQRARRTVADQENRGKPHSFGTYAPKAFAAHDSFDDDLLDRCIQIPTAPATREVEPLLADDMRLERLRWDLYRFTTIRGPWIFYTPTYRYRRSRGDELDLMAREWELWWPMECIFDLLEVPEPDREVARRFYRRSIRSTKATIPTEQKAVLLGLRSVDSGAEFFEVDSPELKEAVNWHRDGPVRISDSSIGRWLKRLGLVTEKTRPRTGDGRVTRYVIDGPALRDGLRQWGLQDGE